MQGWGYHRTGAGRADLAEECRLIVARSGTVMERVLPMDGHFWSEGYNDHLRDDFSEVQEAELDMARIKAWTPALEIANDAWYRCKRTKDYLDSGACWIEGEVVRREHWRHQLQVQEAGCEEALLRYGKCLQYSEKLHWNCRHQEGQYRLCMNKSYVLVNDWYPLTRLQALDNAAYTWYMYSKWSEKRDEYVQDHPEYLQETNVHAMNLPQLYKFLKIGNDYVNEHKQRARIFTTMAWPKLYRLGFEDPTQDIHPSFFQNQLYSEAQGTQPNHKTWKYKLNHDE